MRTKVKILEELRNHARKLDPQHYELAAVAMIETEVQIDVRDILHDISKILEGIDSTTFLRD